MKKCWIFWIPIYIAVMCAILIIAFYINQAITTGAMQAPVQRKVCFIIDAGHGGVDGGAVSCSGIYESHINLQIASRLNDLMHLLGYQTLMIRTEDISIHTSGQTIGAKKASDLKERVRIVNETPNAILLSIHQNFYADSYYKGAQVFYPNTDGSQLLAKSLQTTFVQTLNVGSKRQIKQTEGLYLFRHIQKTGVLIECGFLSNYEEEMLLRDPAYQKKICCVIATTCANYLLLQNQV